MENILEIARKSGRNGFEHYAGLWYRSGIKAFKIEPAILQEMLDKGYLLYMPPDEKYESMFINGHVRATAKENKGTYKFSDEIMKAARKRKK